MQNEELEFLLLKISLISGIIMFILTCFSLYRPGKLIGRNLALLGVFATGWILGITMEKWFEINQGFNAKRISMFFSGFFGQLIILGFINFSLFGFPPIKYNNKQRVCIFIFSLGMASLSWFGVVPENKLDEKGRFINETNLYIIILQAIWFFTGGFYGVAVLYQKKIQIFSALRRTQLSVSFWGLFLGLLGGAFAFFINEEWDDKLRIVKYIGMTTSPLFFLVSLVFSLTFTRSYFYNYSPNLKEFISYLDLKFTKQESLQRIRNLLLFLRKKIDVQLLFFIKEENVNFYYDILNPELRFRSPPLLNQKLIIYYEDIDCEVENQKLLNWFIEHECECLILSEQVMVVFLNKSYGNNYLSEKELKKITKEIMEYSYAEN